MPGPIPYRTEDLSRERDVKKRANFTGIRKGVLKEVTWFECPNKWHPSVKNIWNSLPNSGIFEYYQDSDLAFIYSLLEDLDAAKRKNGTPPAMLLGTIYQHLASFGFSEGERRRMRIELEADKPEEDPVEKQAVEDYKNALNVVPMKREV